MPVPAWKTFTPTLAAVLIVSSRRPSGENDTVCHPAAASTIPTPAVNCRMLRTCDLSARYGTDVGGAAFSVPA